MELLIMHFSQFPCHFSVGTSTPASTLFSNTFSVGSSVSVTDQVLQPYKLFKIVLLCILMFTILGRRCEDTMF